MSTPEQAQADTLIQAYHDTFQTSLTGQLVLEDLVRRFGGNPYQRGGVDAARETDYRAGSLRVVTHILNQVNRAEGLGTDNNEG